MDFEFHSRSKISHQLWILMSDWHHKKLKDLLNIFQERNTVVLLATIWGNYLYDDHNGLPQPAKAASVEKIDLQSKPILQKAPRSRHRIASPWTKRGSCGSNPDKSYPPCAAIASLYVPPTASESKHYYPLLQILFLNTL